MFKGKMPYYDYLFYCPPFPHKSKNIPELIPVSSLTAMVELNISFRENPILTFSHDGKYTVSPDLLVHNA